ncbi:hypothetical protein DFH27DRAFT_510605 [Peziza echinospora]|nr:hypothetical protein DFH27DRAFT_510605 [Peziza echinospora]
MAPPKNAFTYPKLPVNKVVRYNTRASYDTETIHTLINASPLVHISFNDPSNPSHPAMLPMMAQMGSFSNPSSSISDALDVYLHSHITSRLSILSAAPAGLPITISAAKVDGLVLSLSPFSHSYNYRSAVVHGTAELVTDDEEKMYAMEILTEGVVRGRWAGSRRPSEAEIKSTGVVRVRVSTGSAKSRVGGPGEERRDLEDEGTRERVWAGVVPVWEVLGEPVPSGENRVAEVPEYLAGWVEGRSREAEGYAVAAVTMEKAGKKE